MNLEQLFPDTPQPPKAMIYSYVDGSGNTYSITEQLIQYDPMTANYSSSGVYDGGKAAKVVLSPKQFEKIRVIIHNTSWDF